MWRALALGSLALCLVACGGGDGGAAGSGAKGGSGGNGGGGGHGGTGGAIQPPPVPDSCTPPVTAADVKNPTTTITSCDEAGLSQAIASGGVIVFDCGADTTITVTSPKTISKDTVIDGGGTVTLSGGGAQRIFVADGQIDFTLQNITLQGAFVNGPRGDGPSDANSGAAI